MYFTIKHKAKEIQTNPNPRASNLYTETVETPEDYLEYLNKKIFGLEQATSSSCNLDNTSSHNHQIQMMIATIYERAVFHANNTCWEASHRDISILLAYEPYNSDFMNLNLLILNNM